MQVEGVIPIKEIFGKFNFFTKFILKTLLIIVVILAVNHWVCTLHRMKGNNMFPAVRDGDLCAFYKHGPVVAGDIVLYQNADDSLSVARIIATEGQMIDFPEEGGYEIDSYAPSELIPYQTFRADESSNTYPMTIASESYFVMNDYRSDCNDSRKYGVIEKNRIKGKLLMLFRRRGF